MESESNERKYVIGILKCVMHALYCFSSEYCACALVLMQKCITSPEYIESKKYSQIKLVIIANLLTFEM